VPIQRLATRRGGLSEGETFESPVTGARLEVKAVSAEELLVERVYKPGMGGSRLHVHLDFAEQYQVVRGVADARLDDLRLRITRDNPTLFVPPGVPHVNPRNLDTADLVMQQRFTPPTEGVLAYVRTLGEVLRDGRDDAGDLPAALVLAVFDVTGGRTYLGRLPFGLQRRVLQPLGAAVAAARGYAVWLPD
jgi:mannose-6-phosphate isomerase-like protein (cupin superfamily)